MSQHDFDIANQTAPNSRADINLALKALASNSSGSVAPTTTYANMTYYNTATNILYKRNEADSAWITLGTIDETAGTFTPSGERALATQVQAEAGTDNTTLMTPLRTAQASKSHTLLGTLTTTSGSTQTLSGLSLSSYVYVFIKLDNVSHDFTASASTLRFGSGNIANSISNTNAVSGLIWLNLDNGQIISAVGAALTANLYGSSSGYNASSTSLSFSWTSGGFDSGSIKLYGVK